MGKFPELKTVYWLSKIPLALRKRSQKHCLIFEKQTSGRNDTVGLPLPLEVCCSSVAQLPFPSLPFPYLPASAPPGGFGGNAEHETWTPMNATRGHTCTTYSIKVRTEKNVRLNSFITEIYDIIFINIIALTSKVQVLWDLGSSHWLILTLFCFRIFTNCWALEPLGACFTSDSSFCCMKLWRASSTNAIAEASSILRRPHWSIWSHSYEWNKGCREFPAM